MHYELDHFPRTIRAQNSWPARYRITLSVRAAAAPGSVPLRIASRAEFLRNPYVVATALLREWGGCEMPACTRELFSRPDGTPYLEVYRLVPLASDGPNTLSNVAALCSSCHREMHHGAHGARQTAAVLAYCHRHNCSRRSAVTPSYLSTVFSRYCCQTVSAVLRRTFSLRTGMNSTASSNWVRRRASKCSVWFC